MAAARTPMKVDAVYAAYPEAVRPGLLRLRELILETADATEGVGVIEETLKWGQPSYLTSETGSGSTVRVAPTAASSDADYAMYFICNTSLVDGFKDMFGDLFTYDGTRALEFVVGEAIPEDELRACIALALTYHRNK